MPDSLHAGVLRFEVDAHLLFQLGEQLVARRSIALAELIKNSYDADADLVTVELDNVTQSGGQITVRDNGSGMTFEEIAKSWMRIAGSNKTQKVSSSRYCRSLAGAKGVGRFASRRLAKSLFLQSVASCPDKTKERVEVIFDWEKFDTDQDLQTIPVEYSRVSVPKDTPTGVTLNLRGVREGDLWTQDDMEDLQGDILSLVSPFDQAELVPPQSEGGVNEKFQFLFARVKHPNCEPDPGFRISIRAAEFPKFEGEINHRVFEVAWGKIWGWVSDDGKAHYVLQSRASKEPQNFSPSDEFVKCDAIRGAHFLIYFVIYKQDLLGATLKVRDASRYGREQGGVRLYLDNFRVFPYGDPGDDWLKLNEIRAARATTAPALVEEIAKDVRRPLLVTPGNNQLFGAVFISQNAHSDLQLTINRERLLENEAFDQLRNFVQSGLYWMTVEYARYTTSQRQERLADRERDVVGSLDDLERRVKEAPGIPQSARAEIMEVIFATKQVAQNREDELIGEIALLRVLASAGTAVIMFSHQLRALVDGLAEIRGDFQRLRSDVPDSILSDYDQALRLLEEWRQTIDSQAKQIGLLVSPGARKTRRRLAVRQMLDKVCEALQGYMRRYGIDVKNEIPAHIRTPPMFEAELYSILLNLITNAFKAVRSGKTRHLLAEGSSDEGEIVFQILDTGVGLARERREEVFKPLVTYSQPDPILGIGTGLGLKVVRDMLEIYNGTARFVDAPTPWNTAIEITLPLDASKKRDAK